MPKLQLNDALELRQAHGPDSSSLREEGGHHSMAQKSSICQAAELHVGIKPRFQRPLMHRDGLGIRLLMQCNGDREVKRRVCCFRKC